MIEWLKSEFEDIMYDLLGLLIPGIMANLIIGYEIFLKYTNSTYFNIGSYIKYMQLISTIKLAPITIIIGLVSSYLVATAILGFFGLIDRVTGKIALCAERNFGNIFKVLSFFMFKRFIRNNYQKCLKIAKGESTENKGVKLFIDPNSGSICKLPGQNSIKKKYTSKIKFYESIVYILRGYFWYQFIQGILYPFNLFSNSIIESYGLPRYLVFMICIFLFADLIYLSQYYHKFLKEKFKP